RRRKLGRVTRSSRHKIRRNRPGLFVPLKYIRSRLPLKSVAAHIPYYADDCEPVVVAPPRVLSLEPLTNRVFIGPVTASHTLVNDGHQGRVRTILFREEPPSQKRRAHGL